MVRAFALAALLLAMPAAAALQGPVGTLHIKVVLVDAEKKATPVPRHALLISDNPATSTPRRVVTGADGTIDVRLRAGNYTVESDTPFAFGGKVYEWRREIDIAAGRDVVLELTAGNAEIGAAPAAPPSADAPIEVSLSSLLLAWQDSVIALWTPTTHASGFVVDASGLIATNQRAVGAATSIEVQLTPAVKVAGNVLASDPEKDVTILSIDAVQAASIKPVPLGCDLAVKPQVREGQEIFTIGSPLAQPKGPAFAEVRSIQPQVIESDFVLPGGSSGGPVFTSAGNVVGLTSVEQGEGRRRGDARVVRVGAVCEVVAAAKAKMSGAAAPINTPGAAPPSATRLPVEPAKEYPEKVLKEEAERRVGNLNPYQMSSNDFDIAFITPTMTYGAQYLNDQMNARAKARGGRPGDAGPQTVRPVLDFANWAEYTAGYPPVLLVRVTPKLVEGFWTKVARGAAQTQGVALPAFKRMRSGFARMQATCGSTPITPIHPFKIERPVSETETAYEGLYVFDPGAFSPTCANITLVLYGEKEPQKADTRIVDPKIVQQIWQDFASYRAIP